MNIVKKAEQFVRTLLHNKLPANRLFHNIEHTQGVVNAVKILSSELKISYEEKEMVLLTAWFHDTGHVVTFQGHEYESQQIASYFLCKNLYSEEKIKRVKTLIGVTQMPQSPSNLLEEIICDADLSHLANPNYCELQEKLRHELSLVFKKDTSMLDWQKENIRFLKEHKYFTDYAQKFFEMKKQKNLKLCKSTF